MIEAFLVLGVIVLLLSPIVAGYCIILQERAKFEVYTQGQDLIRAANRAEMKREIELLRMEFERFKSEVDYKVDERAKFADAQEKINELFPRVEM